VLSDGSYNVKFRIFDAASSGTNLWEGDRVYSASDHRITVQNGLFNIQFGDSTQGDPALSSSLFNTQTHANLYLEVELPTPATATCATNSCASWTEGAMTPRQPLASATYAFNSDTLDGLDSAAFGQLAAANTFTAANLFSPTTASTVALTVKASTAGDSNALEVFDSSGTRQAYFDASGNLNLSNLNVGVVDAQSSNGTLSVGATNAGTLNIGNTSASTALNLQGGTTGGINIGSTGASTAGSTVNIATTSSATSTQDVTIGSNANVGSTVNLDAGTGAAAIEIGDTSTAHGIKIGANSAGVQTILLGNSVGGSQTTVSGGVIATSGAMGVIIGGGFSASDTSLVPFTLDSSSSFTETASTCSTSINDGALYYNSSSGSSSIRACDNGNWEDVVTTSGLGIIAFGVVPDSATNANVGDLAGAGASGASSSGPCKVYLGSTTKTISWTGCTAYSGGRKVIVTAGTSVLTTTASSWSHLCLTGTNNQPTPSAFGTETANLPTFTANDPVLCLADISTGTGQANITGIYDTRTFTTSTHEFAQTTTAGGLALGVPVIPNGANVDPVGASATANIQGIVVASHGDITGTPNVIIATGGPVWAKATGGTAGGVVITSTTAARVTTGTSVAGPYGDLGLARSTYNATCTASAAASCQTSVFFDFLPR
jgi:hypothetical protein